MSNTSIKIIEILVCIGSIGTVFVILLPGFAFQSWPRLNILRVKRGK